MARDRRADPLGALIAEAERLSRIPDLRLATDIGAVPLKHDAAVFGLHTLPGQAGGDS